MALETWIMHACMVGDAGGIEPACTDAPDGAPPPRGTQRRTRHRRFRVPRIYILIKYRYHVHVGDGVNSTIRGAWSVLSAVCV